MNSLLKSVLVKALKPAGKNNQAMYREDFDACAGTYDDVVTRRLLGAVTEKALKGAGLKPGMNCLDLGCGTGHSTVLMAKLVKPKGSVDACDFSSNMVKAAKKKLKSEKHAKVFEKDIIEFLASRTDNSADFIGSFWALEYCEHAATLKSVFRVLKPNGKFRALVNLRSSLSELQELVTPIILKNVFALKTIPPLNFLLAVGDFKKVAESSGLKTVELKEESLIISFATGKDLVAWMKKGGPSAGFRSALKEERREEIYELIQKAADKQGGLKVTFRFVNYTGRK